MAEQREAAARRGRHRPAALDALRPAAASLTRPAATSYEILFVTSQRFERSAGA